MDLILHPRTTRNSLLPTVVAQDNDPSLCPPLQALSPGEGLQAKENLSPLALLEIKRRVVAHRHIACPRHWRGPSSKGSGTGLCKATRAISTPWLVRGHRDSQSLSSGSAKKSSTTVHPFPQELSLSTSIFNATAPRRVQQRNYFSAAQHSSSDDTVRCATNRGTGLGTLAGLLSTPSFGILQHRRRGQDVTSADGTFANAPAKQRIKFSPCQDQTLSVPGQNFPCAWPPAQPRDHGRLPHSPSCLQS